MIAEVLADTAERMNKAVDVAKEDFSNVRTGRASPSLFQKVMVTYYGTPTPLQQLASMQNLEARTLILTPFDKSALRDIEAAIRNMPNLGASPTNDGNIIRVTLPELTQERRKEFVKIVRGKAEDAKVAIRNIRRKSKDDLDSLKGDIGEDDLARGEKELEAVTKTHIDAVDDALKRKEVELLEI
ncbi:MAG: ribosome recycling factor [Actinomycetales bacterium]|nr:ribosome recycling factor [Actinomycetales bacterium]